MGQNQFKLVSSKGDIMKLYNETMRYDVRLPKHAGEIIESEARRTGIQRAVLLRHIILDWIDKKNTNPAIGAGESVILLEIVGDADNPKTGRRWHDQVKYFVGYVIRNWAPIVFIWGIFFKTLMPA